MISRYYGKLIKDENKSRAYELRNDIRDIAFLIYAVCLFIHAFTYKNNIYVSVAFGIISVFALSAYFFLIQAAQNFLDKAIAAEKLDETDETDAAFIAYRKSYVAFKDSQLKMKRGFAIISIFSLTVLLASVLTPFILDIAGKKDYEKIIFIASLIIQFCYFVIAGIVIIISDAPKGVWYLKLYKEIAVINAYKNAAAGVHRRYRIGEDKSPDTQLLYIMPDKKFLENYKKMRKRINSSMFIMVVCVFIILVIIRPVLESKISVKTVAAIAYPLAGSVLLVWVAFALRLTRLQANIIGLQYAVLKENEEENALYIKLHETRTPFDKKWKLIMLIWGLSALLTSIAGASIVCALTKTDDYNIIFVIACIAEIVALYVVHNRVFGRMRFKMMPIEDEIDRLNKTDETEPLI